MDYFQHALFLFIRMAEQVLKELNCKSNQVTELLESRSSDAVDESKVFHVCYEFWVITFS